MEFPLQLHCAGRPHGPMSEQTAGEPKRLSLKLELGEEVKNDVVVIARVKCNLACTAGCRYTAQNILGCVAVERRDLDPDHALDLGKRSPKLKRKRLATNGGLKIKANDRNDLSNRANMSDKLFDRCFSQSSQAQQCRMVLKAAGDFGLLRCLRVFPQTPAMRITSFEPSSSAAKANTGSYKPMFGSRIWNWVVCTPTATPPAPAAR